MRKVWVRSEAAMQKSWGAPQVGAGGRAVVRGCDSQMVAFSQYELGICRIPCVCEGVRAGSRLNSPIRQLVKGFLGFLVRSHKR